MTMAFDQDPWAMYDIAQEIIAHSWHILLSFIDTSK